MSRRVWVPRVSRWAFSALLWQRGLLSKTGDRVAVRGRGAGERGAACSWKGEKEGERNWGHEEREKEKGSYFKNAFFILFAQRIHLDIRVGEHDLDAAIAQAKDKVNEVSFKLEHLIEQIEQIVKEQNYQRVSLPVQLIFSLPARNVIPQTKSLNRGKNKLLLGPSLWATLRGHAGCGGRAVLPPGQQVPLGLGAVAHSPLGYEFTEWRNKCFQIQPTDLKRLSMPTF